MLASFHSVGWRLKRYTLACPEQQSPQDSLSSTAHVSGTFPCSTRVCYSSCTSLEALSSMFLNARSQKLPLCEHIEAGPSTHVTLGPQSLRGRPNLSAGGTEQVRCGLVLKNARTPRDASLPEASNMRVKCQTPVRCVYFERRCVCLLCLPECMTSHLTALPFATMQISVNRCLDGSKICLSLVYVLLIISLTRACLWKQRPRSRGSRGVTDQSHTYSNGNWARTSTE